MAPAFLDFLNSYLESREGFVAVEGALSECMYLTDMVYQGTVLGPALWNAFFGDVSLHVPDDGQHVQIFADDLKIDASCPASMSNAVLRDSLGEAQTRIHQWRERDRVTFDPSKNTFTLSTRLTETLRSLCFWGHCSIVTSPCSHASIVC